MTGEHKEIGLLKKQLKDISEEHEILKKGVEHLLQERQMKFKFTVEKMCKIFKVSTNGYYSWLKVKVSKLWFYNQKISELITSIFKDSFESYGAPRIKIALEKLGHYISRPRVTRLMKANGLFARRKRKFKTTTDSNHKYPIAANILNKNLKVSRINQVWISVSDITYIETKQGWMYLTVVIDLFNRKVVGGL